MGAGPPPSACPNPPTPDPERPCRARPSPTRAGGGAAIRARKACRWAPPGVRAGLGFFGEEGHVGFSLPGGGRSIEPPKTGEGGVREKGSIDRHH